MARKPQVTRAARRNPTKPHTRAVKTPMMPARSPSPPPMLKPGTVDLPEPTELGVPLAAIAHSMHVDARRKFAATYEDITQYMDKCEYLFEHDEFYDKSYKSLAKTITELNKIGTDAQMQEREQLYNALLDWLNTSSFTLEAPTHGAINEHQLIESGQITRDVLMKMLLCMERLRALHITVVDKARAAAELTSKQTDKTDGKRQLLKMVDDSSFVWKTAAAEIVQLLHEERSKGGELVELYADKIRYLMGELEAQASMIQELRTHLDQQMQVPLKLPDLDMKAKQAKSEAAARQAKRAESSQQRRPSDEDEDDDSRTAAAVSALPDFNKQLIATLQKELDECRRQNAAVVARGHETAAKVRFLTEEGNKKDKQISQLQANIAKLRTETCEAEPADASKRKKSDSFQHKRPERKSVSRTGQRRHTRDSVELPDTEEEDESTTGSRMKLAQLIAAAKRQKRPSQMSQQSAADTDVSPQYSTTQSAAVQSTDGLIDATEVVSDATPRTGTGRGRTAHTKPGKQIRAVRGDRGKTGAPDQVTTVSATTVAAAPPDKHERQPDDVVPEPSFEQLGSYWQQSAVKEWTPLDMNANNAETAAKNDETATKPAAQQAVVRDVDMNEAIEMTKLFVAASKTPPQQPAPAKTTQRKSVHQPQTPLPSAATHVAAITPRLFAESTTTKDQTTAKFQQQQQAAKSPMWASTHPTETSESASSKQNRTKTAAEAAQQRAARLSVALFHSDDSNKPAAVQTPLFATPPSKPAQQLQQQQPSAPTTKGKAKAKTGYDLVGFKMNNLAHQAKLLENSSVSKTQTRLK